MRFVPARYRCWVCPTRPHRPPADNAAVGAQCRRLESRPSRRSSNSARAPSGITRPGPPLASVASVARAGPSRLTMWWLGTVRNRSRSLRGLHDVIQVMRRRAKSPSNACGGFDDPGSPRCQGAIGRGRSGRGGHVTGGLQASELRHLDTPAGWLRTSDSWGSPNAWMTPATLWWNRLIEGSCGCEVREREMVFTFGGGWSRLRRSRGRWSWLDRWPAGLCVGTGWMLQDVEVSCVAVMR